MNPQKVKKQNKKYLAEISKAAAEKGIEPQFTIMRSCHGHKTYPADHMVVICYDQDAESRWKQMISIMAGATVITPKIEKKSA